MGKVNNVELGDFRDYPLAERITQFKDSDFITNDRVTGISREYAIEEDYQKMMDSAIFLSDGTKIYQIYSYYPDCVYHCDDSMRMMPENILNSFVESISTIIVGNGGGKCVYLSKKGKPKEKHLSYEVFVFYTDIYNVNHLINSADILDMILKKADLTVSAEGVLCFYNDEHILATLDCNHYAWVNLDSVVKYKYKIADIIYRHETGETLIKVINEEKLISKKRSNDKKDVEIEEYFKIKFKINAVTSGLISYEVSAEEDT